MGGLQNCHFHNNKNFLGENIYLVCTICLDYFSKARFYVWTIYLQLASTIKPIVSLSRKNIKEMPISKIFSCETLKLWRFELAICSTDIQTSIHNCAIVNLIICKSINQLIHADLIKKTWYLYGIYVVFMWYLYVEFYPSGNNFALAMTWSQWTLIAQFPLLKGKLSNKSIRV